MITTLCGDALAELRELESESVHCCVTSPPYWGLRDYGTAQWEGGDDDCGHAPPVESGLSGNKSNSQTHPGRFVDCKCGAKRIDSQLGLEKTPEEYVARMVEVFREVRRVLRKDGTLWLNMGDSYASTAPGTMGDPLRQSGILAGVSDRRANGSRKYRPELSGYLKPKDLCGIPWRLAFALQTDGWWLRSDIIWAKPNPMPESCTDRPTKSHEYIFLLTKSANYFYDAEAIKEQAEYGFCPGGMRASGRYLEQSKRQDNGDQPSPSTTVDRGTGGIRNKRSVWTIATQPYPEAHFATFPEEIPKLCILAGTSAKGCCAKCGAPWERIVEKVTNTELRNLAGKNDETYQRGRVTPRGSPVGDFHDLGTVSTKTLGWQPTCFHFGKPDPIQPCTVLDPFAGSGTTGSVALELGRKAILIELNPTYVELIKHRCDVTPGLQLA